MHPSKSLKQEFLKKWIMGLKICNFSKKDMSILERKKAIKLSADLAIASATDATTFWSRAIIANASKDDNNKILVEQIMGSKSAEKLKKACNIRSVMGNNKRVRSKKILRRSCSTLSRVRKSAPAHKRVLAGSIAKRLVKKRTQVLKSLIPGGESMDEFSLIEETLDYIVALRAQVSVMRRLANVSHQQ